MRIPKLCHHKASGRGVVRLGGRDFYCGKYGTTACVREYERLISEWEASRRSLAFGSQPTLAVLCVDYIDFCRGYYPKRKYSEADFVHYVFSFLAPYYDLQASELTPLRLKAVREKMVATGNSRKYINQMIGRIVRMYRWAAENELVGISVAQALANVKPLQRGRCAAAERDPVKPVSDEVVVATLKHLPPTVATMVRLQRYTGMRPGEVVCIRPSMIDRSGRIWIARLPNHKTAWRGKNRSFYIGPKGQEILKPFLHADPCFSPRQAEAERGRPNRKVREMYDTTSFRRAVQYAAKRAKVDKWSPNQLRHAFATEVRKSFGIEAASVALEHADVSTTLIYAEKNSQIAIKVVEAVG